jgi:hypothetical protein
VPEGAIISDDGWAPVSVSGPLMLSEVLDLSSRPRRRLADFAPDGIEWWR